MRRTRRTTFSTTTVFLALAMTVTVAVMACSGDGDDEAREDRPTSTTVDEETAVLAAYEAGWRAFEEAATDPDASDQSELNETMTGPALNAAIRAVGQLAESQEYTAGPSAELSPEVTEISGERAVIEDCVIDASVRYAADGTVINPADPTPYANETVMVKVDGTWKRSELTMGESCEP